MAVFRLAPPHSVGQRLLIESTAMDVCFAGRRWGKTHAGTQRLLKSAFSKPGSLNWWIGLSSKSSSYQHAWSELKAMHMGIMRKLKLDYREWSSMVHKELRFPNDAVIQMRTAENPESLAGEAVDSFVFDEFTMARESVWAEHLAPTLITTRGTGLFIGVPKGNNWGARLWKSAKRKDGWNQFHFKTLDNPMIDPEYYEFIREPLPLLMQQQELLAEILSGRGQVFSNVLNCTGVIWQDYPTPGRVYVAGLDWARENDYTVLTIIDSISKECVFYHRMQKLSYFEQMEQIRELHSLWNFQRIVSESNAMGGPLCEQLARDGLPIEPFNTNASSKREVIELLQVAFETETVKIPSNELMIDELESMELNLTKTGHPQYAAPKGMNDDIVMSLAMAHWAVAYSYSI